MSSVALSQVSPPETTGRPRRWARHFRQRSPREMTVRPTERERHPWPAFGSRSDEMSAAPSQASGSAETTSETENTNAALSPASPPETTQKNREKRGRHVHRCWRHRREDERGTLVGVGSKGDEISAALSQASPPETTGREPRGCGPRERGRHLTIVGSRRHKMGRGDLLSVGSRSERMSATVVSRSGKTSVALSEASPPETTGRPRRWARHFRHRRHRRRQGDRENAGRHLHHRRQQTTQDGRGDLLVCVGSRSKRMSATVVGRSGKTSVALSEASPPDTTGRPRRWARHFRHRR